MGMGMGMGRYAQFVGPCAPCSAAAAAKNKCLADRNKRSTSAKPTDAAGGLLISFAIRRVLRAVILQMGVRH
jgi:hypothetical protein